MKNIFILLVFFNASTVSFSQTNNFAPIGATWYYDDYLNDCISFPDCGYFKMEAVMDTLIEDKICRKLEESYYFVSYPHPNKQYYIYEDAGIVYMYRDSAFAPLFDFNAITGDTIIVYDELFNGFYDSEGYEYDGFVYLVDSISEITIDGQILKQQFTNTIGNPEGWSIVGQIIEKIGPLNLFFGSANIIYLEYGGFLRCYSEPGFSYQNPIYNKSCDYYTSIEIQKNSALEIYPNPTSGSITVINTKPGDKISILNVLGEKVQEKIAPADRFTLELIGPDGLYFIVVSNDDGIVFSVRVVKN